MKSSDRLKLKFRRQRLARKSRGSVFASEHLEGRLMLSGDSGGIGAEALLTVDNNSPPVVSADFPDVTVNAGSEPRVIDLSNLFSDPDTVSLGDTLTLSIESNSDDSLVTPVLTGDKLTLAFSETNTGTATIVLRAIDSLGVYVEHSLQVNVKQEASFVSANLNTQRNVVSVGSVRISPTPNVTLNEWETAIVEIWYTVGSDTPNVPFDFSATLSASATLYAEPTVGSSMGAGLTLDTTSTGETQRTIANFTSLNLSTYQVGQAVLVGTLKYASNQANNVGISLGDTAGYPSPQVDVGFELLESEFGSGEAMVSEPKVDGNIAVVTYDANDDGKVGLADFSFFVENFGYSSDPELTGSFKSSASRFDYDRDGKVGLSDFSWFVQNFGMSKQINALLRIPGLTEPDDTPPGTNISASVTINVPNAVDHVYDTRRDILYVTTSSGDLERWSYQSQTLLQRFEGIASTPSGLDVTEDGMFAYVGDTAVANGEGTIWKVNLNDGTKTALHYTLESLEQGVYDLAIASNGKLFFTTRFAGSGWNPLRSIDLATDEMTQHQNVRQNTGITRGADRSLLLFQEANISSGPLFTYDADTDTFAASRDTGRFVGNIPAAINPDGTAIAFDNSMLSETLATEHIGTSGLVGLTFNSTGELFFAIDADSDEIVVFDADDYSLLRRIAIDADVTSSTDVSITDQSNLLFVTTTTGIQQIALFGPQADASDTDAPHGEIDTLPYQGTPLPLLGIVTTFSEVVEGVTADDFILSHGDGNNLLTGNEPVISIDGGRTWVLFVNPQRTSETGAYWLSLHAAGSGITDQSGNLLASDIFQSWYRGSNTEESTWLGISDAVDQAWDASEGILYVTTAQGSLQRWDIASQTMLSSFDNIAVTPRGLDVTADGRYAYVGEGASGATGGIVWKVDLTDGSKTSLSFDYDGYLERGVFDLALSADGNLFFTTSFAGSGWTPLRKVDLDTGEITKLKDVRQNTSITRGADYSRLFFQESNISSGPIFTYDAATSTFSSSFNTMTFVGSLPDAVSHDGSLIAFLGSVLDATNLDTTSTGIVNAGGYAFDPERNILYVADTAVDAIIAYDPQSLNEIARFPIGKDISGTVEVSVTGSSGYAFVLTTAGVQEVPISIPEGDVLRPTAEILSVVPEVRASAVQSLTIQFSEPVAGVTLDDFKLTQNGGNDLLDGTVTLQSTDGGTTWVLGNLSDLNLTEGDYQLTLVAVGSGIEDLAGNILFADATTTWTIDASALGNVLLPFQNVRAHVYDEVNGIEYILTSDGTIQRWDVTTQSLLSSFEDIATSPFGFDITPDGQYAYVGEGYAGATGGTIWKVDLSDGTKTSLHYSYDGSLERGVFDLAVSSNGKLFFTTQFAGSGWNPLREVDLATGEITKLRNVRQNTSITRGADYSRLFFQESNISSGPIFSYDANTSSFSAAVNTSRFVGSLPDAVSYDGSLIAFLGSVLDGSTLATITSGVSNAGGYVFDPARDILYVADMAADVIVAYDPTTLTIIDRFEIGEDISGTTFLSVTGSSGYIFLTTPTGVREVAISIPDGDVVRPTAEILSVIPQSRSNAVEQLTISFSEVVTGVTLDDFVLIKDGGSNLLNASVTLETSDGGKSWVLGNLSDLNLAEGNYEITLVAADSGIVDTSGNALLGDAAGTWEIDISLFGDILIPFSGVSEQVYDATGGILYVLTSAGSIERWDVATQSLQTSFDAIVVNPSGFDISPDGQYAFVGEGNGGATGGTVWKVDLTDGTKTSFQYDYNGWPEQGVFDLAVGSNGMVYFTTRFAGSGYVPFRELNPDTGEMTKIRNLQQNTSVTRGADRSLLFFQEGNISSGPLWSFDVEAGSFIASTNTQRFVGGIPDAVSRDGSMVAILGSVLDSSDLSTISIGVPNAGGYAFDPDQDILYVVDTAADEVVAYDPVSLSTLGRFAIDEDVTGSADITVTQSTGYVFVTTDSGIRQIAIKLTAGETIAPTAKIVEFVPNVQAGPIETLTIQFSEPVTGVTIDDFELTRDGSANLLDGTVTLQSPDGGKTWTLGNLGSLIQFEGNYQLSLAAQDSGIQDLLGNDLIQSVSSTWVVSTAVPTSITLPFENAKDHVYDANGKILYILTADGSIERWDVASQTLLSSIDHVAVEASGFDVTPDGQFAYVGEGFDGVSGGAIKKVNLSDGSITTLIYDAASTERGVVDLAISADGKAFFTTSYAGSGWIQLRSLDLATGEFTEVRSVRQNTGISRGPDYRVLFFQESNISSGPIFTYDSDSGTFSASLKTNAFIGALPAAINHDSSLIAFRDKIFNAADLSVVASGLPNVSGLAFDPNRDILFVVDSVADAIIAYDPRFLSEIDRFPIGVDVSGSLDLSLDDGVNFAYVTTSAGIRQIPISIPQGDVFRPVGTFADVVPSIRYDAVDTVTLTFTEAVQGVTPDDFRLSFNGGSNLLTGAESVVSSDGGVSWTLSGFASLNDSVGAYDLTLISTGSDITDLAGNALNSNTTATWDVILPESGGMLLPFTDAVDHVFDPVNSILYFTQSDGSLQRWDVASQTMLASFDEIAAHPRGLDITPDGQFAIIGEAIPGSNSGTLWKVNLSDGSKTSYEYTLAFHEQGVSDVAVTATGEVFFTTDFAGSGWTPLRKIDLTTGQFTQYRNVRQNTGITRSSDYRILFFQESNISSGPIFTYNSDTDTLTNAVNTNTSIGSRPAAISRDGTEIAFLSNIYDASNLNSKTSTGITSVAAYIFNPTQDVLFAVNAATDKIDAYDTATFDVIDSFVIGDDIASIVDISINAQGTTIFLTTSSGIRLIPISLPSGTQSLLEGESTDFVATGKSGDAYLGYTQTSPAITSPGIRTSPTEGLNQSSPGLTAEENREDPFTDPDWQLWLASDDEEDSYAEEDNFAESVDDLFSDPEELLLSE